MEQIIIDNLDTYTYGAYGNMPLFIILELMESEGLRPEYIGLWPTEKKFVITEATVTYDTYNMPLNRFISFSKVVRSENDCSG